MNGRVGFAERIARRLAAIPGCVAVALGGSRAVEEVRADSDWDFGLYYRGTLNPDDVRALGWAGTVFAPGEWGGGIMNGGAWLTAEGQRIDVHYRDLDDVEHWIGETEHGRCKVERLPFYLAGIPTYVVVGELALSRTLEGRLPRPGFPPALQASAPPWWRDAARLSLEYAESAHAAHGNVLGCAGCLARAVIEAAHGRLAAQGVWVLNEKRIVERAGFGPLGAHFEHLSHTPQELRDVVATVRAALEI